MSTGPYEVKKVDTKQLLGDFSERMNKIAEILEGDCPKCKVPMKHICPQCGHSYVYKVKKDKDTYLSLLCLAMGMIMNAKNCTHERAIDETINILNILRAGV